MVRLSYLLVPIFLLLLSCNEKKTVTTVTKENVANKTAKRQTPELTPPPKKPEPKLSRNEIVQNRNNLNYHIVAGSYNHNASAEGFRKKLYAKGYPAIVLEKNGKFRVIIQSFNNKASAIKELKRLRRINKKPDLWLLKQ